MFWTILELTSYNVAKYKSSKNAVNRSSKYCSICFEYDIYEEKSKCDTVQNLIRQNSRSFSFAYVWANSLLVDT